MNNQFDFNTFLQTVTHQPGIYCMYDTGKTILYVGKAKDLKKRLSSYFRKNLVNRKTATLVSNIAGIDIIVTHTEKEALLLEQNYIKQYQPKYNVLLRDDKSYPSIFISADQHPRIAMHRGRQQPGQGTYYGPYPSVVAVRETLKILNKLFPVRQCENSVYRNRTRPCLQYQIGRCLGPCVKGLVTDEDYQQQVMYVQLFLSGKGNVVLKYLVDRMEQESNEQYFEAAARFRDQIHSVRKVLEKQAIVGLSGDIDMLGVALQGGIACIHVLCLRHNKVLGSRSYFPRIPTGTEIEEIIQTFIGQYYLQGNTQRTLPETIIMSHPLQDRVLLEEVLYDGLGKKIRIKVGQRGEKGRYLKLAETNATTALATNLAQRSTIQSRLQALATVLKLPTIKRMECFDISHTMGQQTIASCVVFDASGPVKSEYRRYNIQGITLADDYAAMAQVLTRRYDKELSADKIPDVILIDGGKGQLAQAINVFSQLKVTWDKTKPLLLGVAKGTSRKAGMETLYFTPHGVGMALPADSIALHLIQYIRDESHRHAITGHRKKREKASMSSILESIEGIGPKRRQMLLKYMGGIQPLLNASIEEIQQVPGISRSMAEKIINALKE